MQFRPGNTPGDTVVCAPEARVAWTGNLILGGFVPPIFEGSAGAYLQTIARFDRTLAVRTIIPGHGEPATAAIFGLYMRYLSDLIDAVREAVRAGKTLDEALAEIPLGEEYMPPADSPGAAFRPFIVGLHRPNVQATYRKLGGFL